MTLQVTIEGPAPTQGSHRAYVRGARAVVVHDSAGLVPWRQRAVTLMRQVAPRRPLAGPVAVEIIVYQRRPVAHYRGRQPERGLRADAQRLPPTGRDLDKTARACLDAATDAGWWTDDRQVASLLVERFYADGRPESVRVSAWELQ